MYAAGGAVLGGVGMGPGLAGLQQHNKFNTISNIHKRGGGELITLYIMNDNTLPPDLKSAVKMTINVEVV